MEMNFLDKLSISELESLKIYLNGKESAKLLEEINKRIAFKKNLESGLIDFSSDRMPYYKEENRKQCIELLKEIKLNELPFLESAMTRDAKGVNLWSFLPLSKIDKNLTHDECTLLFLENFFKDKDYIEGHEGVYNTLNYIKNYIYYLLINNNNLNKEDIFIDYDDKYKIVTEQISEIANYLYELRKTDIELKLSIGNAGLYNTTKRIDTAKPLSRFQKRFVSAIAFGTSYEKLEKRNYEDCKRLLFIQRKR